MSTEQHEALKQAEWLEVYALTPRDKEVAAMLRASHALIVQMAEALDALKDCIYVESTAAEWDQFESVHDAIAQYLKGPKT